MELRYARRYAHNGKESLARDHLADALGHLEACHDPEFPLRTNLLVCRALAAELGGDRGGATHLAARVLEDPWASAGDISDARAILSRCQ